MKWQRLNVPLLEPVPPRFPFLPRGMMTVYTLSTPAKQQSSNDTNFIEQQSVVRILFLYNICRDILPRASKQVCGAWPHVLSTTNVRCNVNTPQNKKLTIRVFSSYYLWLSPGNRYLMPGCDGKCFWKCLGRSIVHVAAPDSTIFPR